MTSAGEVSDTGATMEDGGAWGWPSSIWVTGATVEAGGAWGWPSAIWVTACTVEVPSCAVVEAARREARKRMLPVEVCILLAGGCDSDVLRREKGGDCKFWVRDDVT